MVNNLDETRHKTVRRILTGTILVLGVLLVIGTILDFSAFSQLKYWQETIHKFTEAIFYTCIGFICIVLGLERALDISKIDKTLKNQTDLLTNIENHLKSFNQFRYLKEYIDIYTASIGLIEKTQTKMRALIFSNQPKAPDWWNDKVASILNEKTSKKMPIQFDLVICVKPTDISEEFFKNADQRFAIYSKNNVEKYFRRYVHEVKNLVGHDCLIIDDQHFIINFPTTNTRYPQTGMLFENQNQVAKKLSSWFDEFVSKDAVAYEVLKQEYMKKNDCKKKIK